MCSSDLDLAIAVPGSEIAKSRRLARADVPNFVQRPKDHQELLPWTEDDYRRLGLVPGQHRGARNPGATNDPDRPRLVGRGSRNDRNG